MRIATHDKTGNIYIVIDEVINCTNYRNGQWMYVYQNLEGKKFVRAIEEFHEKFSFRDPDGIKYVDRKKEIEKTDC